MSPAPIDYTPTQLAEHIDCGGPLPPWPLLADPRGAFDAADAAATTWCLRGLAVAAVVALARWALAS
jgi:hypothetical protein